MMTKAEEMKIRLDYINDVQELKDIILQQAKEIGIKNCLLFL